MVGKGPAERGRPAADGRSEPLPALGPVISSLWRRSGDAGRPRPRANWHSVALEEAGQLEPARRQAEGGPNAVRSGSSADS